MENSKRNEGVLLVDVKSIPTWLGMGCIAPSQQYYEDACRVRYRELSVSGALVDEKAVERCISNVRYTFSTMRSTRLVYEAGTRSTVFLPCILFFHEYYGEKWKKMFVKYLSVYVYTLYSAEDIQYLYLDEKELDTTLVKANRLAEEFPELKALIANLVEHYGAMEQIYKLILNTTIYDELDKLFDKTEHEKTPDISHLKFQISLLLSRQNSVLRRVVEMLILLLIIESLRARGYLGSRHTPNLYLEVAREAFKDQKIRSVIESLRTIHGSFSRVLQLVEDVLKRYAGKSKGLVNTRSIAKKMLVSFIVSRSFISVELAQTLLTLTRVLNKYVR